MLSASTATQSGSVPSARVLNWTSMVGSAQHRGCEDHGDHAGHVDLDRDVGGGSAHGAAPDHALGVLHRDAALGLLHEDDQGNDREADER